MRRFSLRRRLTLLLLASLVLVWAGMVVVSYREARQEVDELSDARLEEGARALTLLDVKRLQTVAEAPGAAAIKEDRDEDDDAATHISFQAWDREGRLLLHSVDAPHIGFDRRSAFDTLSAAGARWRTVARWNEQQGFQVRVFERLQARDEAAASVARRMVAPLLFGLPLLAVLVWVGVGRGLRPLETLSKGIAFRSVDNLEPIRLDRVPSEVTPLVDSLNALLERLSQSVDNERRFTADAAHELRTPLAAIKVQAQVASAAEDPEQRRNAIAQIVEGVNRTTHLVQQLLLLARLDRPESGSVQPVDLGELAAQCAGRYAENALAKGIDLSVCAAPACFVRGDSAMLDALIGNLIDNAIRYTQEQGRVEVSVCDRLEGTRLSVKDNGPGVPEQLRSRVMDRFYRAEGNTAPGTGLGLSIVERIARVHGGQVALTGGLDGKGFGVTVILPISPDRDGQTS
jgi:two-component system sensor histidine kinase QseC